MVLPLAAALIYVSATLVIKRAVSLGAESKHVNVSTNVAMGLIMQPLWLFGGVTPTLWQPLLLGFLFFLGQCFTFIAISRGDVSVATPLMGTKILFVSGIAVLVFGVETSWDWWMAVLLSTAAVALITMNPGRLSRGSIARTAFFATLSAMIFGLVDILIQVWAEPENLPRFFGTMFTTTACFSAAWYLFGQRGFQLPSVGSRPWLALSAGLLSIQVLLLALSLGLFNDATATNILYSSRSFWSVVLAWSAGHWFSARDAEAGGRVMLLRLAGAVLLFASILLIVL